MHEPDFWTHCAEAMEQTMEGNRLIAAEIAQGAKNVWRRALGRVDGLLESFGKHGHLPPV